MLASPDGANTNVFRIAVPHTPDDDCFWFFYFSKKNKQTLCLQFLTTISFGGIKRKRVKRRVRLYFLDYYYSFLQSSREPTIF